MVEGEVVGEGNPIGHNGKPLHGGIIMKKTIHGLCNIFHREMDVIPNKDPNTTWIYAISRLETIH